ncbi:hypothetical protein BDR05DRAFT_223001 [Suillus weaverae]|nr:hypothetical protein BDR05DRAFT_223001 [Suillus weaverae]
MIAAFGNSTSFCRPALFATDPTATVPFPISLRLIDIAAYYYFQLFVLLPPYFVFPSIVCGSISSSSLLF